MGMRFNPPPSWPAPPPGWVPPAGWQPDPAWGALPLGWQLWVPEGSWASRNKLLIGILTALALLVGVPVAVDLANTNAAQTTTSRREPAPIETALGAESALSMHDQRTVAALGRYPKRWNAAAAPFVRDYQDPNVSAEAWVAGASGQVEQMRAAVMGLDRAVFAIEDPGLRATFEPMVESYKRKLDAVVALWNAVATGDVDAETAALEELNAAGADARQMATQMMDRLRPYMTDADLERILGGQ